MSETKNYRNRWLHIRLTADEHKSICSQFEKTSCRKLSEYLRKVLLNKNITVLHRNQSLDDFMAEMIQLRNELNHIGNNFNQSVKKLHTLDHIPEIKTWAMLNENSKKMFFQKTAEIKTHLNKIADKWLQ
ncbi:MAG TPA: plasmid mobilization relaxosome protein MobC [Chitinophagaceae bacterium]|nr:plasmid mobilization relaxosome protein MobC [Chitinophagaceae bacterium]